MCVCVVRMLVYHAQGPELCSLWQRQVCDGKHLESQHLGDKSKKKDLEVQGRLQLHNTFKFSLGYMKPCLKQKALIA